MAEVIPPAENLVTKEFLTEKLAESRREVIDEVRVMIEASEARLEAKIEAVGQRTMQWMLGLFVPVWGATAGILVAAIFKLA
jgi:hypothetical protein